MTTATNSYSSPIQSIFATNPLTTTFSGAPSTCTGLYSSGGVAVVDDNTDCLPPGFSPASTEYFSPGIACPAGYVTACKNNEGVASITTVTCCPVRSGISLNCVTPSTLNDVWSTLFCTWRAPSSATAVVLTISNHGGTTSTVAVSMSNPDGLNAMGVRMVYESTDLVSTTSDGSGSTPTSTGSGTETSSSGSNSSSGGGLSTGATAAIAVVVSLVGIAAVIGAVFLIRKRKQRRRPGADANTTETFNGYYDPKTTGDKAGVGSQGNRNGHQELAELGQESRPSELPEQHAAPVELPASEEWRP